MFRAVDRNWLNQQPRVWATCLLLLLPALPQMALAQSTETSKSDEVMSAGKEAAPEPLQAGPSEKPAIPAETPVNIEETPINLDEESVDLDDTEPGAAAPVGGAPHAATHAVPFKLKIFFDVMLEYGFDSEIIGFSRNHAYLMVELPITDWLQFRADVAFEPAFYEMSFRLARNLELRAGKVLIPFGQNEFHHLIGGRVDEQSLFLPTTWADHGAVVELLAYDGELIGVETSLWVINGFSGESEPRMVSGFGDDNNLALGVGTRAAVRIGNTILLGTSWYYDSWDLDSELWLLYYGADLDLSYGTISLPVLRDIRLRGEIAWGEVELPGGVNMLKGLLRPGLRRSGYHVEISYRILDWLTVRYREGRINPDSRYKDANDLLVHEPGVTASFGPAHVSLLVELHTWLAKDIEPLPSDQNRVYARLFLRY